MAENNVGLGIGGGLILSNTAILILGALAGGCIAYKFFKNGDVHLKSERALTNQNYIADEIYKSMRATAANPATVEENEDRIRDMVKRNKADFIGLGDRLRKRQISPRRYRDGIRGVARYFNHELGISQRENF